MPYTLCLKKAIYLAYYDSEDFNTMQEEAIMRVQEMQQRSRNIVNPDNGSNTQSPPPPIPPNSKNNNQSNKTSIPSLQKILGELLGGNKGNKELFKISNIKIDEEKALIALMIYILYKNGSDIKLLLALGYLLL